MDQRDIRLQTALDRSVSDAMSPIAGAVAVLFAALAVLDWMVLPPPTRGPVTLGAVTTSLFALSISIIARRLPFESRATYPLCFALVFVLNFDSVLFSYFTSNSMSIYGTGIALVGVGFFVMHRAWAIAIALSMLLQIAIPIVLGRTTIEPLVFYSILFSAGTMAVVTNALRMRHIARLENQRHELETALAQIKHLKGLLPICAACKRIRDDQGYWTQLEAYISDHSEAEFTHGICPECREQRYPRRAEIGG